MSVTVMWSGFSWKETNSIVSPQVAQCVAEIKRLAPLAENKN